MAEWNKALLLLLRHAVPPLRLEFIRIAAPDFLGMVDRIGRHTQRRPGREGVSQNLHRRWMRVLRRGARNQPRQAQTARTVNPQRLIDDVLQIRQILNLLVLRHPARDTSIQLLLQLRQHARCTQDPVEQCTGSVGRGVGTGNQLCQRLGRQLAPPQRLALGVLPLHQPGQQIHALGVRIVESLRHSRNRNAREVLHRLHALTEEGIGQMFRVRLQRRETAQRSGDLSPSVQHLDGGGERDGPVRRLPDLGHIFPVLEHAEGGAEGEIPDDVEGEVVEPVQGVERGVASLGVLLGLGQLGPARQEHVEVGVDVLLELADGLRGEGVRDDLALAGVFDAVAGIEEAALDADEGVVVFAVGF